MFRALLAVGVVALGFLPVAAYGQDHRGDATGLRLSLLAQDEKKEEGENGKKDKNGEEKGEKEKEHKWDKFEPYDPNEEERKTSAGTPLIVPLLTEQAFLEREINFLFFRTNGVDDRTANREALFTSLTWQLNNRLEVVFSVPFFFRHPTDGEKDFDNFGDVLIGGRFLVFDGEHSIFTVGLNVFTPTGSRSNRLGNGFTTVAPAAYWWQDLGNATVLQTELSVQTPVGTGEGTSQLNYNFCLMHTFPSTGSWTYFQWLTPTLEVTGRTDLNGASSGRTVVNLTPGIIWLKGPKDQFGVGFSFPVTHEREFDSAILLNYLHSF
jgi:hypothetical protein